MEDQPLSGGALPPKEEEDPSEEAFNTGPFDPFHFVDEPFDHAIVPTVVDLPAFAEADQTLGLA